MTKPTSSSSSSTRGRILQFAPMQSLVDDGFWRRLSSLKLDTLGIDQSPINLTGFYAPCSHAQVSNHLTLLGESLPPDTADQSSTYETSRGNRNRCPVPGILYNTNTLESFHAIDRKSLLNAEAKKILEDICSGKVEEDSSVLSRFLLISFADLKKWSFCYWFAFPALVLDPPATLINLQPASNVLSLEETESLSAACNKWRNSSLTAAVPFFLVSISCNSHASVRPLKDWEVCQATGEKLFFGFYDPCHLPNHPGWPLRNFLAFISLRWKIAKVHFFSYREKHGLADMGSSLIGEASISLPQEWRDPQCVPKAVGWELHRGKLEFRSISLAETLDPERLAVSAADLNLKLMRWRTLPSLNIGVLSSVKCLLLGAGKLGCQVARTLMGWGVRKITLLDNGRVAMSNPLRQSLYTTEDCVNGGDLKALAAARRLKRMFPAAEAEGIVLTIPMLGHPVPAGDKDNVLESCKHLQELIASYDVIFLLTDTKESRWLPTLLCANENKVAITATLGSDSYLVMRHGAGPFISRPDMSYGSSTEVEDAISVAAQLKILSTTARDGGHRLGCYHCSDVVAPTDSSSDRTLNEQSRQAPTASSLAAALLVEILHHPDGIHAPPGEIANSLTNSSEQHLGILPHQIQGSFAQFSVLSNANSSSCTACSTCVVSEYRRRGMDFILQAINDPTYLEDLTGLTKLMKSAAPFKLDQDVNPERLSVSAADLNLKLMRWPTLPSLNRSILSSVKCLLLGAGTLGCEVARSLLDWGVRKITLVDNGRVAMSNPVRQSLYTFEDCLNGGDLKAVAAARSLKQIITDVEAEGIALTIPMPGHPVLAEEEDNVLESCKRLQDLIASHDAIFLLTDTRESRWLPTLLCANENKVAITAALGFDSFLAMRHGAGPFISLPDVSYGSGTKGEDANCVAALLKNSSTTIGDGGHRLGCYFCSDVIAPIDSTSNRTLDQQCTVTRPELAPIVSDLAVESLVRILHHPDGIRASGEIAHSKSEQLLGVLPHQIRGSLYQKSQMTLLGYSSNSCTACSTFVVAEYRRRGMDFILQAINHPTYLEDLTGLTELKKSATSWKLDWDCETEDEFDI